MSRGFKNKLCQAPPPQAGGWMNPGARRGCIRHGDHPGMHRNRYFEWEEGQTDLASPRAGKTLSEIRERADKTQVEVAKRLGKTQASISKLERQPDMMVSTLRSYLEALGAKLELRVRMSDGQVLKLEQFDA